MMVPLRFHYASVTAPPYPLNNRKDERSYLMEQLQIAYLPRRGTEERWRRLWQEVAELCPEQFAAACQQAGITQLQVRLMQLLHSELLLVNVQMQEPQQTRKSLTSSQSQFLDFLGEQLQALLGWDIQELLDDPPVDLLFTWER
jgi:hypothetical protein